MSLKRVVIADDHAVFRTGLKLLLESQADVEVVGFAGTTNELKSVVANQQPDIILLDLSMPGGSSIPAIKELREISPPSRILVLTMHDDPVLARAALAAGASGFLVKTIADQQLIAAIQAVSAGGVFIDLDLPPNQVASLLTNHAEQAATQSGPLAGLSAREQEVFVLLAKGHTNQEIADSLDLSVKTIETYRSRIGEKLGLRSRSELTRFALETGIL